MFTAFVNMVLEMAPYLLLGFLVAGVLHSFVPRTLYKRHLANNSFGSVVWATLLGIPLPLCSCGVIPTAMSLRKSGASKGATVAFLISTPQTGVDSILATASMLGWQYAILRPVAALVTALFGGSLTAALAKEEGGASSEDVAVEPPKGFVAKCRLALRYGFVDMMQDIGKWLVVGLAIAAVITIAVPDNFFTMLSEEPLLNMLVVLLFSIPMYLCATGSIPIAVALMLKGLSPGAALVLLMAGPATNMAAILVIRKVLGMRTLLLYLLSIVGGALAFGLFVDLVLPQEWFTSGVLQSDAACASCISEEWWRITSAILLALLLINAFIRKWVDKGATQSVSLALKVKGMRCNHCKANVERAISSLEGVVSCEADIVAATVRVEGTAARATIIATIERLGFEVVE